LGGAAQAMGSPEARIQAHPGAVVARVAPGCLTELRAGRAEAPCLVSGSDASVADAPIPDPACTAPIIAVDERCESWVGPRYDGGELDAAGSDLGSSEVVASSPDGSAAYSLATSDLIAGSSARYGMVVVAQDGATGQTKWTARTEFAQDDVLGLSVAADPDGDLVYALGEAHDWADPHVHDPCPTPVLVALDASTGEVKWTQRDEATGVCAFARTVEVDPAGERVYVVGGDSGTGIKRSFRVTSYEAGTGAIAWRGGYTGDFPAGASASALAVSPDGSTLYVGGSGLRQGADWAETIVWTIVAFDVAAGEASEIGVISRVFRWDVPKADAPSTPANPPAAVGVSPDGRRVFIVGGAEGLTLFDIFTVAFDTTTGEKLWEADYEGPRAQIKSSFDSVWYHSPMAISADGGEVFVTGYSTSMHGVNLAMDFVTLSYDAATGVERWETRYVSEQWIHWFPSVAVHPNGDEVYVSGQVRHFEAGLLARYTTLAYGADDGAELWVARHTDGGSYWNGMAMSPDGRRLFVSGTTQDLGEPNEAGTFDLLTVGYSTG
ncbi:MAG: PQQ-binding-like beta-propeller repeat protein, partial [Actinomycetota bacterium]